MVGLFRSNGKPARAGRKKDAGDIRGQNVRCGDIVRGQMDVIVRKQKGRGASPLGRDQKPTKCSSLGRRGEALQRKQMRAEPDPLTCWAESVWRWMSICFVRLRISASAASACCSARDKRPSTIARARSASEAS